MQGKTHAVTGLAVGLAAGLALGVPDPLDLVACTVAGGVAGLVPDWLQVNVPGASKQIKGAFGHRGFSHWVWTPLVLLLVSGMEPSSPIVAAICGWFSHIVLDALSGGVPAFWPFGRVRIARIKTGSNQDTLFGGAALVIAASLAVYSIL
jgi:inner membrane protein